jgi:hypothetical protein
VIGPPVVDGVPTFEFAPFAARVAVFDNLVCAYLDRLEAAVVRIAFGAILQRPAENRDEAYEWIGRLAPSVKVDPANTRELIYRVNRPKMGAHGIELNRIMTWSAAVIRKAVIANQTTAGWTEENFTRLEIDNSTPAERTEPLDRRQLVAIFKELEEMAAENAARGELP